MTCRDAQADIALYAGGDLDDAVRVREVRRHVASCPGCREHFKGVKSSLRTLASVDRAATWQAAGSLWPAIQRELGKPRPTGAALALKQVRNWTPLAAMTAACAVMLMVLNHNSAPPEGEVTGRGMTIHPPTAMRSHSEYPAAAAASDLHRPETHKAAEKPMPPAP